jgi:hypothetical protein
MAELLDIALSDPHDTKHDSKRLLTTALGLDLIFDLAKAKAGTRNAIGAKFGDLLNLSRSHLSKYYQESFTLNDSSDNPPFYIVVRGQEVSENFYLPLQWEASADALASPTPNSQLETCLSRLYDYGDQSREVSDTVFKRIFFGE